MSKNQDSRAWKGVLTLVSTAYRLTGVKIELSPAIDEWLLFRASEVGKATLRKDKTVLKRFLAVVGNVYVSSISGTHVARFMTAISDTVRDPGTKGNYHSHLTLFLDWAEHQGYLPKGADPMYGRKRPKAVLKERNRLHVSAFPELLAAAEARCPRDRAVVAVMLYTLLRQSEATDIRIGDVDLEGGYIRATIHKKQGLEDLVPISPELDRELRYWLAWYTEHHGKLDDTWYLLPVRRLSPRFNERHQIVGHDHIVLPTGRIGDLAPIIKPILQAIDFPVVDKDGKTLREGAHTLRRSGARALAESLLERGYGDAKEIVKEMLHHESVSQTEVYIGMQSRRMRRDALVKEGMYAAAEAPAEVTRLDVAQ